MHRPLVGTLATAVMGAAALVTAASPAGAAPAGAPAHHPPKPPHTKAVDFAGTVALDDCSGSIVKMPTSQPNDPALVMTNGHCLESGMPDPGQVIVDQPSSRSFTVLDKSAGDLGTLQATKIVYATMTGTDVTLYQTGSTYAQIEQKYGIKALELSTDHPAKGAGITVVSGYWKKTYTCSVDGFVPTLKEGGWSWKDSVRYTPECKVIGGTSGSPVVDNSTGKVTAINNTINENGERCTENNPCEVDENGNVTVREGINYAQETYGLVPCIGAGNKFDLSRPGCALPKP
ncbi:serine protease [Streptomyces sp. NPDC056405]|uniref:S1 family peptidase n=1 Tax=Streptomyces sp. NPDC056405 TaxID=3345811 RepID=UPI0035E2A946